jgi:hypothetical protein
MTGITLSLCIMLSNQLGRENHTHMKTAEIWNPLYLADDKGKTSISNDCIESKNPGALKMAIKTHGTSYMVKISSFFKSHGNESKWEH